LEPGSDAVLQLHMQPTGKPEPVRCSVGLYFTNQPPTNAMFKIVLTSLDFEIPAGKKDFLLEDSYVLPVDVEVRGVKPHTHYLARDLQAFATRPDGTRQWLLHIPQWDFFWQQDYRLAEPIRLPRGTRLTMRYTFDNSAENPRNPHRPPQNVRYGPQTTDEMAELWIQVVAASANDFSRLANDARDKATRDNLHLYEELLRRDPRDAKAHASLGRLLFLMGRGDEAAQQLRTSLEISPSNDVPHYYLGVMQRGQNQLIAARTEFETALTLNPDNYKAHGNLAQIAQAEGRLDEAEQHARAALRIYPGDGLSRETLDAILQARGAPTVRPAK
jgi:tetratricopeptide (TPR) repeat protein